MIGLGIIWFCLFICLLTKNKFGRARMIIGVFGSFYPVSTSDRVEMTQLRPVIGQLPPIQLSNWSIFSALLTLSSEEVGSPFTQVDDRNTLH